MSTNMPSIGAVICEIGFEFQKIWEKNIKLFHGKTDDRVLSVHNKYKSIKTYFRL